MVDKEEPSVSLDDERIAKSEAVRLLGVVPKDKDDRMARSRWTRPQIITLTMQETQEEALNPERKEVFLSATWRNILARNNLGLDGLQRVELQSVLEMQAEERAVKMATEE